MQQRCVFMLMLRSETKQIAVDREIESVFPTKSCLCLSLKPSPGVVHSRTILRCVTFFNVCTGTMSVLLVR